MKRLLCFLIFYCACHFCVAGQDDILMLRKLYYLAPSGKKETKQLEDFLARPLNVKTSIVEGYRSVCMMLNAQHSWNPYDKIAFFNRGKNTLDEAIKSDPGEIELKFIRFCVQLNAPGFLGYSADIASDKTFILSNYSLSNDMDLKTRIKRYLEETKCLTPSEKLLLK